MNRAALLGAELRETIVAVAAREREARSRYVALKSVALAASVGATVAAGLAATDGLALSPLTWKLSCLFCGAAATLAHGIETTFGAGETWGRRKAALAALHDLEMRLEMRLAAPQEGAAAPPLSEAEVAAFQAEFARIVAQDVDGAVVGRGGGARG